MLDFVVLFACAFSVFCLKRFVISFVILVFLQVHPCVHEVSLNLCIVVCCMAVAAVVFVSFEFGPSLAYALHVQCATQQLSSSNF